MVNSHQHKSNMLIVSMRFSGVGANLFFILTVSLLSWYHWSDSVWMEETRKRLRNRAEESRRKRNEGTLSSHDIAATSNDEKSFDDDEDISIIEDKPHRSFNDDDSDDIEELSGFSERQEIRRRKLETKSSEFEAN